jgi:predicted RNA binding protein YcfA (HicA-like mRNA interferase family)
VGQRLPRVTADQVLRALGRDGWQIVRQRGSHATLVHSARRGTVTVPRHSGMIIKPKTLATILDQAGLSHDEFRALL